MLYKYPIIMYLRIALWHRPLTQTTETGSLSDALLLEDY